ncbi:MAG: sugar phosphate isomerase/epimerase [Dehalococcoidia bacterium]
MPGPEMGFHCHKLEKIQESILDNGLNRGEFFNFPSGEIEGLRKELANRDLARSVHAPLLKPDWYPDPPTWSFLCDVAADNRNLTFRMITETLARAGDLGAEYVIVHFPTPSTDGEGESSSKLASIAWKSCDELAELSVKWDMPIHIEGLGSSPYLNDGFLAQAMGQYPLKYCFDTGHMNLAAKRNGFDLYDFAAQMAPFVGSIHLWNNRGEEDYANFRHIPVHPSQDPEEGWVDISRMLQILKPSCPVIFESPLCYPEELGEYDYRDGVEWVKGIMKTLS